MTRLRSHNCGELASNHIGTAVTLMGWVHARRNLGGLQFIDLSDMMIHTACRCSQSLEGLFIDAIVVQGDGEFLEHIGQLLRRFDVEELAIGSITQPFEDRGIDLAPGTQSQGEESHIILPGPLSDVFGMMARAIVESISEQNDGLTWHGPLAGGTGSV